MTKENLTKSKLEVDH